jgi:hypothetical protein
MRTPHILLIGGLALFTAAGLSLSQDKTSPSGEPKATATKKVKSPGTNVAARAKADYPVITYLEGRDRVITIKNGPKGPLYSVRTSDGKVLCENLSKEQLSAKAPDLGEFLNNAVAGPPGSRLDASIRFHSDALMR